MKGLAACVRMRGPGGWQAALFTTEEEGEDTEHTEKRTQPSACLPDPSAAAPRRGSAARPPTHGAGTNNQPSVALRPSSVLKICISTRPLNPAWERACPFTTKVARSHQCVSGILPRDVRAGIGGERTGHGAA